MRILSVAVLSAAVVTGLGGSVVAYEVASVAPSATSGNAGTTPAEPVRRVQRPDTRFRFAACTPPAKLVDRACVTDVVRTIVLPAEPAAEQVRQAQDNGVTATSRLLGREPEPGDGHDDDHDDDGDDRDDSDDDTDHDTDHDDDHDDDDGDDDDETRSRDD